MTVRRRRWRDPVTGAVKNAWMVDVKVAGRDGLVRRVRRVAPVQNRRAAERLEHQLRQELLDTDDTEPPEPAKSPLLVGFSERFVATYAATNNKPSEVESKRTILRLHILPELGRLRLGEIGPAELEHYKSKKLKQGLSRKTVNNHLTVLRKMLATAVEWHALASVPVVRWLDVPIPDFDFLSFDEANAVIDAADDDWHAMITVAFRAGLRHGELLALRWDDIDLGAGRLVVRRAVARGIIGTPKNGKSREVPLSEQAASALRDHQRRSDLVFAGPEGEMLTKGACKWPLWRASMRAGLRRIGWHVARHTFASHLVMRGVPLKTVQELLGHSSIEMTMRYAHLSPDARRDAVRVLDIKETVALSWTTSKGVVLRVPLHGRVRQTAYDQGRAPRSPLPISSRTAIRFPHSFHSTSLVAPQQQRERGDRVREPRACGLGQHVFRLPVLCQHSAGPNWSPQRVPD